MRLVPSLALALAVVSAAAGGTPVSRAQIQDMLQKRVDVSLIVSLIEKDCVDFEVTGANLADLSAEMPQAVLKAAIDCRKAKGGSPQSRPKAPAAEKAPAPAPERPAAAAPAPPSAPDRKADPSRSPEGRLRVVSAKKLGDECCIDELRYPCDAPGEVWIQTRHAFGRTEHHTLDVTTGRFSDGAPPCSTPRTKVTSDEEGPADFSPDGKHQITRSPGECGYMDDKCRLRLDGSWIRVEGEEKFKYPQFVWIDGRTVFLTNFGGVGGGPDGFWLLGLAAE